MKTPLLVLASLFVSFNLVAQSSVGRIEINNVAALVQANGTLFFNPHGQDGFNIPANEDTRTIFAASLSMGGLSTGGGLHLFSGGYYSNGLDLQPGPLMDDTFYPEESLKWDKVWSASREQINEFRAWYYAGVQDAINGTQTQQFQFPGYTIPEEIANWPANGDVSKGQRAKLAPYHDANGDDRYDPSDGDYPKVRGDYALWFVFNDDKSHPSGGTAMGVQVSAMMYGFNCGTSQALDHTLFLTYEFWNPASSIDYTDVYLSNWVDFEIGNGADDYIGVDVDRGAFYGYNADDFDENSGSFAGYGSSPPAQAVVVLGGPLQDFDGVDNLAAAGEGESVNGAGYGDGVIDNERLGLTGFMVYDRIPIGWPGVNLQPQSASGIYNGMRSLWVDGTPVTHGATGYSTDPDAVVTRFMYPGTSNPLGYGVAENAAVDFWSQRTADVVPGDMRGTGSIGPFSLSAGATQTLDLAFVYGRDPGGTVWNSISKMQRHIDEVRVVYEVGGTPCGTAFFATGEEDLTPKAELEIYPNPATDQVWLRGLDQQPLSYRILSMTGQLVQAGVVRSEQASIGIRELPAGVYLFQVDTDTQRTTHRLVKK